jgi:hypothetical protein
MNSVLINGVPVQLHASFRRNVADAAGVEAEQIELTIIIRGRMPNKQFVQHVSGEQFRLDFQEVSGVVTILATLADHVSVASGEGEAVIYRHDLSFRETPASAQERHAAKAASQPAPEPIRLPTPMVRRQAEPEYSDDAISADAQAWGAAIRQLKTTPAVAVVREEPLPQADLVAIESVLTNLRIDALIDQLEAAGLVRRGAIDEHFRTLVERRFVAEAIPLVGEKVARRALRDME